MTVVGSDSPDSPLEWDRSPLFELVVIYYEVLLVKNGRAGQLSAAIHLPPLAQRRLNRRLESPLKLSGHGLGH